MTFNPRHIEGLSICMIVKDEEKNLQLNIPKILPWTKDLVLLDSGSSDRTEEVIRGFGLEHHVRPFTDFAEQKNAVCDLAKNKWVLVLDADEHMEDGAWEFIASLFERGEQVKHNAWCLPRFTLEEDGKFHFRIHSYPCFQYRLFDRTQARYDGLVHEDLIYKGKQGLIPHHILHRDDNFEFEPGQLEGKVELYNSLKSKMKAQKSPHPTFFPRLKKKLAMHAFIYDSLINQMKLHRKGVRWALFIVLWFAVFWFPPLRRYIN